MAQNRTICCCRRANHDFLLGKPRLRVFGQELKPSLAVHSNIKTRLLVRTATCRGESQEPTDNVVLGAVVCSICSGTIRSCPRVQGSSDSDFGDCNCRCVFPASHVPIRRDPWMRVYSLCARADNPVGSRFGCSELASKNRGSRLIQEPRRRYLCCSLES